MGSKLSKKLKQRSKYIESITPPPPPPIDYKGEIQSFHEELINDNSTKQTFKTSLFLTLNGKDKEVIRSVLSQLEIVKHSEFISEDYSFYPERIEKLIQKLKDYRCIPEVDDEPEVYYHVGHVDESILINHPRKKKVSAKANSLDELKKHIRKYGPALYSNGKYKVEELIRINPTVYQDVCEGLSDISNTHENDKHEMWKGQDTLLGEQKIGDLEFFCLAAGSDYEVPTVFIIYLDIDGDIRGYVPIVGNAFHMEYEELEDYKKAFDWDKIKQDILSNIQVV